MDFWDSATFHSSTVPLPTYNTTGPVNSIEKLLCVHGKPLLW